RAWPGNLASLRCRSQGKDAEIRARDGTMSLHLNQEDSCCTVSLPSPRWRRCWGAPIAHPSPSRTAWTGDENILVATALTDDDPPIAFDVDGRRQVLDPKTPPTTPVLAVVPVETDFSRIPSRVEECIVDCGGGGGPIGDVLPPPPPPPGLYMTKSHFVQDFEGWLKGSPEFEVHM